MELGDAMISNHRRKLVLHLDCSDCGLVMERGQRNARLEPSFVIMQPGKILCLKAKLQVFGSFFDACLNANQVLWNKLLASDIS